MSHVTIFKTDYGHILEVLVNEYDELTGISSPAYLSSYTTKTIIAKKPSDEIVSLTATASGLSYLYATTPIGFFSEPGHYIFTVLLENALQRFHSTEFGTDIVTSIEG